VTLDSVQEFRVTTTNPNAEQGRSSGAQIGLVTKSGTNEWHGSLYEFHRNTVTTANTFFNNMSGIPRPKLLRNVFGGSAGGPVRKDRLFFFFNYEGRRDARETSASRTVPSAELRQGIFRYNRTGGGVGALTPEQVRQLDPARMARTLPSWKSSASTRCRTCRAATSTSRSSASTPPSACGGTHTSRASITTSRPTPGTSSPGAAIYRTTGKLIRCSSRERRPTRLT
jgi:hypothetical protein